MLARMFYIVARIFYILARLFYILARTFNILARTFYILARTFYSAYILAISQHANFILCYMEFPLLLPEQLVQATKLQLRD